MHGSVHLYVKQTESCIWDTVNVVLSAVSSVVITIFALHYTMNNTVKDYEREWRATKDFLDIKPRI